MSRELIYLFLIFGLLVVPRALQRFQLPAPITCLILGLISVLIWSDWAGDQVVTLLSTLGISSLFLFAGLEVDLPALRRRLWPLLVYLAIWSINMALVSWAGHYWFALSWQTAVLIALALLTPSTGFILDTLERLGLDEEERFWVTNKAIAGELLALAVLCVVLQADDPVRLGISTLVILAMLFGLPLLFLAFGRWIVPYAPGSEFSLLVMVGFVAAFITYQLGVYYLVGAFIAGFVARQLRTRTRMPRLASDENIQALRLFASFFVPFYFFNAGMQVSRDALSMQALLLGLVILAVLIPLRVGVLWLQRRVLFRGEERGSTMKVSVALAPTLVFTLVLTEILHSRFGISDTLTGALLLYTTLNTLFPSLVLRVPFDLDPVERARGSLLADDATLPAPAPSEPPPQGEPHGPGGQA